MNVIIRREGEGEVVEGRGFKHIVKARTERMVVILTEMEPGAETDFYEHEGEEFRFVLYGKLECNVGGFVYELGWRDSMLHPSAVPHKVRNVGREKAIYLTVCSPPSDVLSEEGYF